MTKSFYIGKLVTSADNTNVKKTLKDSIWIARVFFPSLDKAWQYMLGIPDPVHQLEVTEDVAHQQVLLSEIIGSKHKIMAKFLKEDWKAAGMAKKTITDLMKRI